jgi:transcriptional regulator of nitric oxide reductase
MDAGILALMIPIIGVSIPIVAIWAAHKQKMAKIQAEATVEQTAEKAAQYASQVQGLEDRVRVLERIVTDKGYDVASQIEALRDTREVEQSNAGVPLNIAQQEKA